MTEPLVYVAFFIFAALTLGAALAVVTSRNLLHSALFLVLTFFSVAGLYVLLEAEFLAAVQVLIYVGAVAILFLFALMVTRRVTGEGVRQSNEQRGPVALVVLGLFAGIFLPLIFGYSWYVNPTAPPPNTVSILGDLLMTAYALPLEVAGVILLVALVGAIILAKEE